jgi:hypothetical protein
LLPAFAGFLLVLLLNPEDGAVFASETLGSLQTAGRYSPEDYCYLPSREAEIKFINQFCCAQIAHLFTYFYDPSLSLAVRICADIGKIK